MDRTDRLLAETIADCGAADLADMIQVLEKRLAQVKEQLAKVEAPTYLETIKGSLGVDPAIYNAPGNNLDRPVKGARIA